MTLFRAFVLVALLPLAGCGNWNQSIANPSNWFQGAQADATVPVATELPGDPRPLVDQVIFATLEPFPGGAIVRATGLPSTQGYWDGALVAKEPDEKGQLVLTFHLVPPDVPYPPNTQRSREVVVAYMITDKQLSLVSSILVQARTNSKSLRP